MRQERDALGDWSIDEDAFYGIATARLVSAVNIPGPAFPPELPGNLLRIRQAQAVAFGRSRQWPDRTAAALAQAAARLAATRLRSTARRPPLTATRRVTAGVGRRVAARHGAAKR